MIEGLAEHLEADRRTRERIRIALDANMLVEAGAGTGKTRALVDRYVALVLNGTPVERIVAITFTEKAAAEMRERVRGGLEAALREADGGRPTIEVALAALDRAQISTIHAFCQAALRSFAAEAGLDPDFTVLDEVQAERRFAERWRNYLEELAEEPAAVAAIDRALGLGLTTGDLETLARALWEQPELLPLAEASPPQAAAAWPDLTSLRAGLAGLPLDGIADDDPLKMRILRVISLIDSLAAAPPADGESLLAAAAFTLELRFGVSNAGNWGGGRAINEARDAAQRANTELKATLTTARTQALANLLPLLCRFVRAEVAARGREGALTFADLILSLRDLLRDHLGARHALRERYDTLLLDEFQDTDPAQMEIARGFVQDADSGRLDGGRLFIVGDPKQSIYRFRRADMAIYEQTRSWLEDAGGEFPQLALNRRSQEPLLRWVNQLFERLLATWQDRSLQPPYRPIHPERNHRLRGPGVGRAGGGLALQAHEVRVVEASDVAALCRRVIDEGWQVSEREGTVRSARLQDVAILIPSRTGLYTLERALTDAGIAYQVEGGSLVYRTQELRDLTNCLAAIDDPADEVAIVGALRSPAYACSDLDLARFRAAGGRFNYLRGIQVEGLVAEALASLRVLHESRQQGSIAALIERFLAERGLMEIGILDRGDRNWYRRLRFLAEQARAFEAGGPQSLRAFVRWLEQQAGATVLRDEGSGLDEDEEAVRIFTIHGAKGLEFPIVLLAGFGTESSRRTPPLLADAAGERLAVSIGSSQRHSRFMLGPLDELDQREREHEAAEQMRLLYVAATRARDHLVVSLYHRANANSAARQLVEAGVEGLCAQLELARPAPFATAPPLNGLTVDLPDIGADGFAGGRQALLRAARARVFTSATALGRFQKEGRADASEPWAGGRGGTHLGRAVHAAIQSLSLSPGDTEIEAFARAQAVAEAIPERAADVAELVRRALGSQPAVRARGARRALREVPYSAVFGPAMVEGFIDMVIESADGIEIVDWKTDQIEAAEVLARLAEYRLQAGLYVLGLETVTGRPVQRVTYVFVSSEKEESPGTPDELRELARAALADAAPA